jgi:hypothetical protein
MMTRTHVFLMIGTLSASCCFAQNDVPTSLECWERLRVPRYPPLARSARFAGTAHVRVQTDRNAALKSVQISGVQNILRDEVDKSVRESQLSRSCTNAIIDLEFVFVIEGQPTETNDPGRTSFGWPNQFLISTRPPIPEP